MNFFEVLGCNCKELNDNQILFLLKLYNRAKEIEKEQIDKLKNKQTNTKVLSFD